MKRGFLSALLLSILAFCLSSHGFAVEPVNLAAYKHQLIRYHDTGRYDKDISRIASDAIHYLENRLAKADFHGKKPAIVLDIDETSLSNYPNLLKEDFGGTGAANQADTEQGNDPVIEPTLKLYQFAKANQVAVFFITGRLESMRQITIDNLEKAGYHHWDGLILRDGPYKTVAAEIYKSAARKSITEKGYDIVLNLGDQKSDLAGGYADKPFKLPNPYYFIP